MNLQDAFASLILRPHEIVTVRSDYHWLRVTEGADLGYSGGGAQNDHIFGFPGIPPGRPSRRDHGPNDLAHLADVSATVAATSWMTLTGYYGHAFGGSVVRTTFAGSDTDYGFVEMTLRY